MVAGFEIFPVPLPGLDADADRPRANWRAFGVGAKPFLLATLPCTHQSAATFESFHHAGQKLRVQRMGVCKERVSDLLHEETGQDMIEYIFIAGLIGLAAIVSMSGLATKVATLFNAVGSTVTNSV